MYRYLSLRHTVLILSLAVVSVSLEAIDELGYTEGINSSLGHCVSENTPFHIAL